MLIRLDDPQIAVRLNVSPRARRFTLRLASCGEEAVLTLPSGVPVAEAEGFVRRQSGWLRGALARQAPLVRVGPGTSVPVDGTPRLVEAIPGPRRAAVLHPDRIVVSGPGAAGPRLAAFLKNRATARMVPMAHEMARLLGVPLRGVALKDTRSRWGSCSSAGRINLSWRLAMAPAEVQDYLVAHEAAHLVEMNHQPAFWRTVERLYPDYAEPRNWLRRHGRALHAYRFD